jgi:hypothetical protein
MNSLEWLAGSTGLLAITLRGLANYGLSLSGMPCALPIEGAGRAAAPRRTEALPRIPGAAGREAAGRK